MISYRIIVKYFAVIILLLSIIQCNRTEKEQKIILIHVNDMHAQIDRLPQLYSFIDSIKKVDDEVYILSAGDIFSGNPIVDQYSPKGYPMIELMNHTGFCLNTLGNHGFDYGQSCLRDRIKQAQFDFLCANIHRDSIDFNLLPHKVITTKKGVKVSFIGLIQVGDNGLPDSHPAKMEKLSFTNPIEVAGNLKEELEQNSDIQIALTHLGYEEDSILAMKYPYLEGIIGGHSHTFLPTGKKINKTFVAHAGAYLNHAGVMTLTIKNKELVHVSDTLISLKNFPTNRKMQEMVDMYNNNPELRKPLAKNVSKIKTKAGLGKIFTKAIKEATNVDIALQNNGGIRIRELAEGEIDKYTVFKMDPFGNEILTCLMTPDEIKSLIKYTYINKGRPVIHADGISYEIILGKNNEVVEITLYDETGKELENKEYKVAFNSYMAHKYNYKRKNPLVSTGIITSEAIINYLLKHQEINFDNSFQGKTKSL